MTEIDDAMLEKVSGGAVSKDIISRILNSSLPKEIKRKLIECTKKSGQKAALQMALAMTSGYPQMAGEIQQIFSD